MNPIFFIFPHYNPCPPDAPHVPKCPKKGNATMKRQAEHRRGKENGRDQTERQNGNAQTIMISTQSIGRETPLRVQRKEPCNVQRNKSGRVRRNESCRVRIKCSEPSKVGQTRRAPDSLPCGDGRAGDSKEAARVAGALEEILGFSLAVAEEFDEDLVLDVVLDVLVLDVLVHSLLVVAWDVFFRRSWRPGCACRREAVGERLRGIGLRRPVVAGFCREGV